MSLKVGLLHQVLQTVSLQLTPSPVPAYWKGCQRKTLAGSVLLPLVASLGPRKVLSDASHILGKSPDVTLILGP